jgi:type I restriction enzyme S subunit
VSRGWVTRPLGDIAFVGAGNSAPQDDALFAGGKHPFFRTSDVGRIHIGTVVESEDKLNENGIERLTLHTAGTILIPKSGASTFLDHRVIMGVDGYVSSHLATVRARPEIINTKYLFYYLLTVEARSLGVDTAYPTLSLSQVNAISVALPPLSEQLRIVAILDDAFAGLTIATKNARKNLKNARELFDSYLSLLVTGHGATWEKKRLPEVAREFGRGKSRHRPRNDPKLYGGPYPFVQTGDISNADHWLTEYTQTYSSLGLAQSRQWPRGTVCIAIVGATVGETAILDFEACFPDSVIGIVVEDAIADSEYVEYLLQAFKALLKEKGKGTARDNINLGTFEKQFFPFPPLKEQRLLVRRLNEMAARKRELEDFYDKRVATISELRQSILQKAFSGELTSPPSRATQEAAE